MDQLLYPVSQKSAAWDWNHCDTHLRLSVILKTITLTEQLFLECKKDGNHWARGPRFSADKLAVMPCMAIDLAQLTMNFDRRHALCIQNFITDRTSQSAGAGIRASIFKGYNDATVRIREVQQVLYHVHAVASRNKWFNSCGTNGKLTLWTPLVRNRLPVLIDQNFCGNGLEHRALPRRRTKCLKTRHSERGQKQVVWYHMLPCLIYFLTVRYQQPITKNQQLSITYLTKAISTKTNSTALSYLSVITNKTAEMIAVKIFKFVEVATLSHGHEETGGFFLRFYERTAVIYVNREGCEWQVE